jgi:hypothetical protein
VDAFVGAPMFVKILVAHVLGRSREWGTAPLQRPVGMGEAQVEGPCRRWRGEVPDMGLSGRRGAGMMLGGMGGLSFAVRRYDVCMSGTCASMKQGELFLHGLLLARRCLEMRLDNWYARFFPQKFRTGFRGSRWGAEFEENFLSSTLASVDTRGVAVSGMGCPSA